MVHKRILTPKDNINIPISAASFFIFLYLLSDVFPILWDSSIYAGFSLYVRIFYKTKKFFIQSFIKMTIKAPLFKAGI